ncbi:MAG: histidinol-phosphatase HisJ [bacterium]|nr:histidinol-phosphatase HisJ [bacterium]
MIQRDGHFHTQFCRHGKRQPTEAMLERAVELGFQRVSLTEHAPLPEGAVADARLLDELALRPDELEPYLEHCRQMKAQFKGRLEVLVGLELDFVPGFEQATVDLVTQWGEQLEDSLLSLHFLPGSGAPKMLDFSPEDFTQGLLKDYGTLESVHAAYWEWLTASARWGFKSHRPKRIGHPGLIYKFTKVLGGPEEPSPAQAEAFLDAVQAQGYQLDHNHSGYSRATCGRAYLPKNMENMALQRGLELVYGSDAHGIDSVGGFYQLFPPEAR